MGKIEDCNQGEVSSLLGPEPMLPMRQWHSGATMKGYKCHANTLMLPYTQGRAIEGFYGESNMIQMAFRRITMVLVGGQKCSFSRGFLVPYLKANPSRRKSVADFFVGVLDVKDVSIGIRGYNPLTVKQVN